MNKFSLSVSTIKYSLNENAYWIAKTNYRISNWKCWWEEDEGDYTMCKVMAIMAMMMMNIRMHAFIDNM